jgi:Golgi transport complex subunit 5
MSDTIISSLGITSTHLDLSALLSPTFSPHAHASTLVLKTTASSDPPPIDLATPLSRALFDAQEIDVHIHALTSRSAVPILEYTRTQNEAAQRIVAGVDGELERLNGAFGQLEREVGGRWERADWVRRGAERGLSVVGLLRGVQRVVAVARALEGALVDGLLGVPGKAGKEDHRTMVRACYSVLAFREIMQGSEGEELGRVHLVRLLRARMFDDAEERLREWARKAVREFSLANLTPSTASLAAATTTMGATFKDAGEAKARFTSATHILYLLSPAPQIEGRKMRSAEFEPELLIRALQGYVQNAVQSSGGGIARALGALPQLERVLGEVSVRCQTLVAMERVLREIEQVQNPLLVEEEEVEEGQQQQDSAEGDREEEVEVEQKGNMLEPLLHALDTASLPSYFWRSLAAGMGARVQEILNRGGVAARTLKSNRDKVGSEIRECVLRGSQMPVGVLGPGETRVVGNWEREAAVMVGSVLGVLGVPGR